MKTFKIIVIILVLLAAINTFTFAQNKEATETSTIEPDPKEIMENVKQLVRGTNDESDIYFRSGKINQISDDKLILENGKEQAEIQAATDAAILRFTPGIGNSELTFAEIEQEEFLIAMGYQSKTGNNLFAKRIIISPPPTPPTPRKLLTGKVAEIDATTITISNTTGEKEITYNSNTTTLNIQGVEDPSLENIVVEDDIAVVYIPDEQENIADLKSILIIPGEANPESKENVVE